MQGRIIGGANAERGSWRWITVFGKIGCSGSVIHPNFVLTAGHCCSPSLSTQKLTFWIGDYDLNDFNSPAKRIYPDEIIRHPDYYETGLYSITNDICLIYSSGKFPNISLLSGIFSTHLDIKSIQLQS